MYSDSCQVLAADHCQWKGGTFFLSLWKLEKRGFLGVDIAHQGFYRKSKAVKKILAHGTFCLKGTTFKLHAPSITTTAYQGNQQRNLKLA
jgi:hypothetical protein